MGEDRGALLVPQGLGISLGTFRVIHPESRYSQPKPALGKAMPVHESHPEIGHANELFVIDCYA